MYRDTRGWKAFWRKQGEEGVIEGNDEKEAGWGGNTVSFHHRDDPQRIPCAEYANYSYAEGTVTIGLRVGVLYMRGETWNHMA